MSSFNGALRERTGVVAERVIDSIRRWCLDHVLELNEVHLLRVRGRAWIPVPTPIRASRCQRQRPLLGRPFGSSSSRGAEVMVLAVSNVVWIIAAVAGLSFLITALLVLMRAKKREQS